MYIPIYFYNITAHINIIILFCLYGITLFSVTDFITTKNCTISVSISSVFISNTSIGKCCKLDSRRFDALSLACIKLCLYNLKKDII